MSKTSLKGAYFHLSYWSQIYFVSGFSDGDEGGGPRCRHGTGAREKLKGFIAIQIKITATLEEH